MTGKAFIRKSKFIRSKAVSAVLLYCFLVLFFSALGIGAIRDITNCLERRWEE